MKFENQKFYNCKVTTDSGEYLVSANWLHNNNLDHWKGWSCDAGFKRLSIDEKFNVYSGECMNDYLGNLTESWECFNKPTVCQRDRCTGCTDDLLITKSKND